MSEAYAALDKNAAQGMKTNTNATSDIASIWANVRNDATSDIQFLWVEYNGSAYVVKTTGSCLQEMADTANPDCILFGGVRVKVKGRDTFFHVLYVGSGVSVVKRGKGIMLRTAAFNSMEGCAGDVEVPTGVELTKDILVSSIAQTARCQPQDITDASS